MSLILCIETAAEQCSVCIADDNQILHYKESSVAFSHSRALTAMISECIDEGDQIRERLSYIAVSIGPGSYTGLRTGLSVAKGLAYALDCKLIIIDTLEIIAEQAIHSLKGNDLIASYLDARRDEVYLSIYDQDLKLLKGVDAVILDKSTLNEYSDKDIYVCGNAISKCERLLDPSNKYYKNMVPNAKSMHLRALAKINTEQFADIATVEPEYIKAPNITTSKKRLL